MSADVRIATVVVDQYHPATHSAARSVRLGIAVRCLTRPTVGWRACHYFLYGALDRRNTIGTIITTMPSGVMNYTGVVTIVPKYSVPCCPMFTTRIRAALSQVNVLHGGFIPVQEAALDSSRRRSCAGRLVMAVFRWTLAGGRGIRSRRL